MPNQKKKINRFNRKKLDDYILKAMNDVSYSVNVAKNKRTGMELKEILPTKEFRNWCKKMLEKCGMDRKEASLVMSKDFQFETAEGLYDFFMSVLYDYMNEGNKVDMISREDFKATLSLKEVPERTTERKHYNPQDRSYIGTFKEKKKKHKELRVKSSCPKYLKEIQEFM